jgi:hypothetical protein
MPRMYIPDDDEGLEEFRGFDGRGWKCDTCGKVIEKAKDGWVQWLGSYLPKGVERGHSLQLVHHVTATPLSHERGVSRGCQFSPDVVDVLDSRLPRFLGPDGLMLLLEMIERERVEKREVLEMIKRLHIPGYDRVRNDFEAAINAGVFESNTTIGYHPQKTIQAVNEWVGEQEES